MKKLIFILPLIFIYVLPSVQALEGKQSQFHKVPLDLANLMLSKEQWQYGVSKEILDTEVSLFQNRRQDKIVGNLQSILKITAPEETFEAVSTMKKECATFKEVYTGLDIKDSTYDVEFNGENPKFPSCWVKRDNPLGSKVNIFLVTKREGRTKDFSYMLHTFTFNFPTNIKNEAIAELKSFLKNITYP